VKPKCCHALRHRNEQPTTRWKKLANNSTSPGERIRQIEAKALRKLRHPSRSEKLKSFLDGDN